MCPSMRRNIRICMPLGHSFSQQTKLKMTINSQQNNLPIFQLDFDFAVAEVF